MMPRAPPAPTDLVEAAIGLARRAGALALQAFTTGAASIGVKGDGSVVTAADRDVEAFLRSEIEIGWPDDALLGEEYGARAGTTGRRWIIDPIDGTEAFVHGVAEFSTLLAIEDAHGILAGVIDIPAHGETLWAGRGSGAFLNGEPFTCGSRSEIRGAYVATSDLDDWPDRVVRAAREAGLRPRTWGGGYGIGLTVSGRVDAFVDYDVDVWDVAPVAIIATEAGGRFSALDGSTRLDAGTCLVSNPALHDALLVLFGEGSDR